MPASNIAQLRPDQKLIPPGAKPRLMVAVARNPLIRTGAAVKVALLLIDHFNPDTGRCNPSLRFLARESGVPLSTIERAVRQLVRIGWLKVSPGSRSRSNAYELPWRSLDAGCSAFSQPAASAEADPPAPMAAAAAEPGCSTFDQGCSAGEGRGCSTYEDVTFQPSEPENLTFRESVGREQAPLSAEEIKERKAVGFRRACQLIAEQLRLELATNDVEAIPAALYANWPAWPNTVRIVLGELLPQRENRARVAA